jgi:hypothetical protein
VTTNHDQQAQAVGLFLSAALLQTDRVSRRSNVRVTA